MGADADDVVLTNKLAGTFSSVIRTPQVEEGGLRVGFPFNHMLKHPWTKSLARMYLLKGAIEKYDQAAFDPDVQYWQAGKGVDGIEGVLSCQEVIDQFGWESKK